MSSTETIVIETVEKDKKDGFFTKIKKKTASGAPGPNPPAGSYTAQLQDEPKEPKQHHGCTIS